MTPEQALIKVLGFGPKVFIEKAIEGGWEDLHALKHYNRAWVSVELKELCWLEGEGGEGDTQVHQTNQYKLEEILLDPESWKAVGKVEAWDDNVGYRVRGDLKMKGTEATLRMLQVVDALCETV